MRVIEEAKKLISINSVTGSEKALGYYLEERFRELGCSTRLFEAAENRFNIYAEIKGRKSELPGLLFHGHLDTVAAHGMASAFTPALKNGRLYGRGSVDQKGGIAAVITAFEEVLTKGKCPDKTVAFIGVIDEEAEHRGSMALESMGIKADFAVVTEPTGLRLGIGCKGTAPIRINVRGQAAHGCRPWLGRNAVLAGIDIAQLLMKEELPVYDVEDLGRLQGSINLGKIDGGRAYNIVADRCSIWFDRRLVPGETQAAVIGHVNRIISDYDAPDGIIIEAEIARPDWDWEPIKKRGLLPALTDMSSPMVSEIKKAHETELGSLPELFFTDGYQEMDFLINDLGINAVQYGPGDSSLCHTDEEYLDIKQLEHCSRVYLNMIRLLCG